MNEHPLAGLYIKIGQQVATMNHILPAPFLKYFSQMNDQVTILEANLKSIFHRCYFREVAFERELNEETIYLPLGCLQGGVQSSRERAPQADVSEHLAGSVRMSKFSRR